MQLGPLKLALVTRRYPPLIGGAEKVLSYLAGALAAEGAEVTVVTSQVPGLELAAQEEQPITSSSNARFKRDGSSGRLSIMRLDTSKLRFWGTWRYMRNLRRWFQKNPVDLAYVSMLKHDAYSVLGSGEHLGFPVVLRPEGAGATGDIAWQSRGNFGRTIGRRCRDATAFVTISNPIEHELREAWCSGTMRPSRWMVGLHQTSAEPRIQPIPNGVPVPEICWQRRPDWRTAPRVMFVGRLAPEKGLDTLIDAWPQVLSRYTHARLILVGEGPLRPMLEERVKGLGMTRGPGQTVEFSGVTTDPTETLRQADLFVLPSREEGMSIALLEAMALGIPLVASAIPGNRQIVGDFKHGRLSPPDDPGTLARVIIDQWDNFDRAFHMSRAARSRVDQEFSIRSVARKHLALFEDILRNR
jgi:glycosyltransferase involved in cell wall biosynthesis